MKTFLPLFTWMKYACLAIMVFITTIFSQPLNAQLNLLANPGFESPAVPVQNGNNIMGAGVAWGGWNATNGGLNIIRVTGSGYTSGANTAADGNQYVDITNSDGYITSTFVLVENSPILFSGSFSNREAGWAGYSNWTGRIDILDSLGVIVASSSTLDFITTTGMEDWYTLSGSTSNLPAGVYTYRSYIGNWGHFDNAAVFALNNSVLPIKLESFTAVAKNKNVVLNWVVSEEINVKQYEAQFSADGKNFRSVGIVAASNTRNYGFVHTATVNGANYYRLKTLDRNGKSSYSAIRKVNFATTGLLNVFPNPASGKVNVTIAGDMQRKPGSLSVIGMNGLVMIDQHYTSMNQHEILDISRLTPGAYIVRIVAGGEISNKPMQVVR